MGGCAGYCCFCQSGITAAPYNHYIGWLYVIWLHAVYSRGAVSWIRRSCRQWLDMTSCCTYHVQSMHLGHCCCTLKIRANRGPRDSRCSTLPLHLLCIIADRGTMNTVSDSFLLFNRVIARLVQKSASNLVLNTSELDVDFKLTYCTW